MAFLYHIWRRRISFMGNFRPNLCNYIDTNEISTRNIDIPDPRMDKIRIGRIGYDIQVDR